jgi:hypothetical protein
MVKIILAGDKLIYGRFLREAEEAYRFDNDPEKTFRSEVRKLAVSYKEHGCQADYGIITSFPVWHACANNQSCMSRIVEEEMRSEGIQDVAVRGVAFGSSGANGMSKALDELGEELEFFDRRVFFDEYYSILYGFDRGSK